MPLEAPCQDTPDLPFANFEVTHKDVIGVAQNSIIKYNPLIRKELAVFCFDSFMQDFIHR